MSASQQDDDSASPSGPSIPRNVWTIPSRNPGFIGRESLLEQVREHFVQNPSFPAALYGRPGMGKTELAKEYAHRFSGAYELIWWLRADRGLLKDQFVVLATELGIYSFAAIDQIHAAVRRELDKVRSRLLIFDGLAAKDDVADWLPGFDGHVLITSREPDLQASATLFEVSILSRDESVAMLRSRAAGLSDEEADKLASDLGDMPLALTQAANFMTKSGMSASEYLTALRAKPILVMGQSKPQNYPISAAAIIQFNADELRKVDSVAYELASLCAFFDSAPIANDVLVSNPAKLPALLAERAIDPFDWRQTIAEIVEHSLADTDALGNLQFNKVTQAILRGLLEPDRAVELRRCAEALLVANAPGDPTDPATWPKWSALMRHLLATEPATSFNADVRSMACDVCLYLLARGCLSDARKLIDRLYEDWRVRFGEDAPDTAAVVNYLMRVLIEQGLNAEAHELAYSVLDRRSRELGVDDPLTLTAASQLASSLSGMGKMRAARRIDLPTLAARRRVLGKDHPDTLASASNVVIDRMGLGIFKSSRLLAKDNLKRRQRVQGKDHPDTLQDASNLANITAEMGDLASAKDLAEVTLARRQRVLGADHPDSLIASVNLAEMLAKSGGESEATVLATRTLPRLQCILGVDHWITHYCEELLRGLSDADGSGVGKFVSY